MESSQNAGKKMTMPKQHLPENRSLQEDVYKRQVLGAVLVDSSCLTTVMEYIKPECFYDKRHQGIFAVMLRFFGAGQPIDFVTVLDGVISDEVFASEQDAKVYLARLVEVVPTVSNVEAYARIIQEKHYLRSLIGAAQGIIENARDPQNEDVYKRQTSSMVL